MDYTPADMMAVLLAREIRDGDRVFHGLASPLPMVAILLARSTHAPNLVYLNITGAVDPTPSRLPTSTVDPALWEGARSRITLADIFDLNARGEMDLVFFGAAQVDRRGRINLSAIGPWEAPKVRLPGGAGSAAMLPRARRAVVWRARHDRRTLVESVDFVTASGNLDRVITPYAVFERRDGLLTLRSRHPYVSDETVVAETGFALTPPCAVTAAPTAEELEALRRVDPGGVRAVEFGSRNG